MPILATDLAGLGIQPGAAYYLANYLNSSTALPRLPSNRSIAILGDSRTFQCTAETATEYSKMSQGYIGWLQYLTRQRIDFELDDNYGVSGENTAQMYARIPEMLRSTDAGAIIFLGGTNDWSYGFTALGATSGQPPGGTDTLVNLEAIYTAIRNGGRICIMMAEMPRGDSTNTSSRLSASNLKRQNKVREYVLNLNEFGVYTVDPWQYLALANATNGDCIEADFKDGLHPNASGAYYTALALQPLIESLYSPVNILPQANSDVYDASLNPLGCLNSNPVMDGTGGTKNTGASGNLADNWSENATPGFTRTYSKVTSGGKTWQQVVLGGTATATGISVRQVITPGLLTVGDRIQAVCELEMDVDVSNIVAVSLQILDNGTISSGDMRPTDTTMRIPAVATSGILETPIYTITSTTIQIQIFMQVVAASNPVGTLRFARVSLRKIQD